LRAAVDDEFKTEFRALFVNLEKRLVDADTLTKLKDMEGDLRKKYVQKAIYLLCEKNEPTDLDRIRKALSSGVAALSSLTAEYLRKHGEWQDIGLLISMVERTDTGTSLLAGLFEDDKTRFAASAIHAIAKGRFAELCAP
jgi:hypothetical protein